MESSAFARRIISALYVLVFAVILVLAGKLGLFGDMVRDWLQIRLSNFKQIYLGNKTAFDWTFLIIGTSVPAVTGTLTILKGFYYGERNLPGRLQEFIKKRRLITFVSGMNCLPM